MSLLLNSAFGFAEGIVKKHPVPC